MRQTRKQFLTLAGAAMVVALHQALLWQDARASSATLVTAVVNDPLSGLAIDGYDPVAYFTEERPVRGRSEFEFAWRGVPWLFVSAANRDAFARAPEVYAPQFGGYGAMGVARGFLSEGNPQIFTVLDGQLFLFHSTGNRDAFLMAPDAARRNALLRWPALSATLHPR